MIQKRKMIHPNFILGLISYLLLLSGVLLMASDIEFGKIMIIGSIMLGALHWFRSIYDVSRDPLKKKEEGMWSFWISTVIMIPPVAGMLYYMVNDKKVSI